jgi:WD40-like Beta Propeller Repeat
MVQSSARTARTARGEGSVLVVGRAHLRRLLAACLLAFAVSACRTPVSGTPAAEPDVPVRQVAVPDGSLAEVAWLPGGRLYLTWAPDGGSDSELWTVPAAGGSASRVRLADQPGCGKTDYRYPTVLPDGRLGLIRLCLDPPSGDVGVLDPATGRFTVLAPLGPINPSAVTWRKDLRSGYLSRTSGSCAGIAALTRAGVRRWPAPVSVSGHSWELDGYVFARGILDCAPWGRADQPVLASDESWLYFLASPESQGVSGTERREETPWRLYRWALSGTEPTGQPAELAAGLGKPLDLAMSPDGRALVFAGQRDGAYGLWRVDPATGQVRRLATGKYVSASFSPDGRQLAAVLQRDGDHAVLQVLTLF